MDLNDLRTQIDGVDRELIELLEHRFDISVAVADYKKAHGLPVLDAAREAEKLASVRAQCRPETADLIAAVFQAAMDAGKVYQTRRMEAPHG